MKEKKVEPKVIKKQLTMKEMQTQLQALTENTDKRFSEISQAFISVENNLLGHMNAHITKVNAILYILKTKNNVSLEEIDEAFRRQVDITNKLLELTGNKTLGMPSKVAMYFAWAKQRGYEVVANDLNAKAWLFSDESATLPQEERLKLAHEWGFNADIGYFFENKEKKEDSEEVKTEKTSTP